MCITPELFKRQCKRRFGEANPERMRNELWELMVRRGCGAWSARSDVGLESGDYLALTPGWCFRRFGMTRSYMPDGRVICVAGEHEDFYDPDFCIYNDVIVLRPAMGQDTIAEDSGKVEIYGYPESVFPPTDFHSATLLGERILLIGRLGYAGTRQASVTPVLSLDTKTYRIDPVATSGPGPGWIYDHHASLDEAALAIVVRGGKVHVPDARHETPNLAAHRLHLADMRWEIVTERETHRRFILEKADDGNRAFREPSAETFRPAGVPHTWIPPGAAGCDSYAIDINCVRVGFSVIYDEVRVLIEGDLPRELVVRLFEDIVQNLQEHTGSDWTIGELGRSTSD